MLEAPGVGLVHSLITVHFCPLGWDNRPLQEASALTLALVVLQVPSECGSHSASCSPEWGSALEFGANPAGKRGRSLLNWARTPHSHPNPPALRSYLTPCGNFLPSVFPGN